MEKLFEDELKMRAFLHLVILDDFSKWRTLKLWKNLAKDLPKFFNLLQKKKFKKKKEILITQPIYVGSFTFKTFYIKTFLPNWANLLKVMVSNCTYSSNYVCCFYFITHVQRESWMFTLQKLEDLSLMKWPSRTLEKFSIYLE